MLTSNATGITAVAASSLHMDHVELNHNEASTSRDQKFLCTSCDKGFKSNKLLKQHLQKVHKSKNIECQDCGKSFSLSRDLRYHQTNKCQKQIPLESAFRPKNIASSSMAPPVYLELPPNFKVIDMSKMVDNASQTDTEVMDAGLQVYIEQPYLQPPQEHFCPEETPPVYIDQYQQTYAYSSNYPDWRHTETQTHNRTSIGTTTPYWPQENGYAADNGTQTWYEYAAPQTTDSYSMTDEQGYQNIYHKPQR